MGVGLLTRCSMDIVSRLIVGVLALLFACETFAYGTVPTIGNAQVYRWSVMVASNGAVSSTGHTSATDACQSLAATTYKSTATITFSFAGLVTKSDPTQFWCEYTRTSSGVTSSEKTRYANRYTATEPGCPANATLSGQLCVCADNFKPSNDGASCVPNESCQTQAAIETANGSVYEGGTFKSLQACIGGCVMTASDGYGSGPGSWWLTGQFSATGANCAGNGNGGFDVVAPPSPLPPGKCPGTVNGKTVVVACSDRVTTDKGTTTTTTTTSPANGGIDSPGPTTTTESTTTCSGGNCSKTTTTTTTNPDGSKATTQTQEQEPKPEKSFCEENPDATICKESSASASCSAGAASVDCDGDAVQCAILREQFTRNCQLYDKTNPQSDAGTAAVAGGDRPDGHPRKTADTSSIAFGSAISQAPLIGSACPADISVPMGGSMAPLVLPLSKICEPAGLLGNVGVGFAALACLFIVFKRD